MPDNRFPSPGADTRFPTPGEDTRFDGFPLDQRFPSPGEDARFGAGTPPPLVSDVPYNGTMNVGDGGSSGVGVSTAAGWGTLTPFFTVGNGQTPTNLRINVSPALRVEVQAVGVSPAQMFNGAGEAVASIELRLGGSAVTLGIVWNPSANVYRNNSGGQAMLDYLTPLIGTDVAVEIVQLTVATLPGEME